MRQLQVAFVTERIVRAEYVKETGEASDQRVEPHALMISGPPGTCSRMTTCVASRGVFRFDRFRNVRVEDGATFPARPRKIATATLGQHCDQVPLNQI